MNVAQICRLALYNADAVLIGDTTHRMFTERELLAWANQGKEQIEHTLVQAFQDYNALILQSDDTDFRFEGFAYDTASLQLTGTTSRTHILPPDFLILKAIREITNTPPRFYFRHVDATDPEFEELRGSSNPQRLEILWDILGERTLYFPNPPEETIDLEIIYIARTPRLRVYDTGTVAITIDTSTVTGTSTLWVDDEVFPVAQHADIMVAATGNTMEFASQTTSGITWVDPQIIYSPISTIATDTSLTLQGNWLTTTVTGRNYMIASVPAFPAKLEYALADFVAMRCMIKAKNWAAAEQFKGLFQIALNDLKASAEQRQVDEIEYAEDFDIPGGGY